MCPEELEVVPETGENGGRLCEAHLDHAGALLPRWARRRVVR
jgi:hypothetical protein